MYTNFQYNWRSRIYLSVVNNKGTSNFIQQKVVLRVNSINFTGLNVHSSITHSGACRPT